MTNIALVLNVEIDDDTDPAALADDVLNFFCEDPDDLFPAIKVVSGCDYRAQEAT